METGTDTTRNFGADALFSQVGRFRLVHLDHPDSNEISRREQMVRDGSFFDDDCPICRAQRERGGDIVFEPEEDWEDSAPDASLFQIEECTPSADDHDPVAWRRTYVDVESLAGESARTAVHGISTGVAFCLLELIDDVTMLGQADRWAESLRYYCACFARFAPALCGSDRLNYAEARNLGAITFQIRSYMGWFRECLPVLETKCADLDRISTALLAALQRFDEDEERVTA